MIEGLISAVFSAYGLTGILALATVWLATKLIFLDKEYTRLEKNMAQLKVDTNDQIEGIRADYAFRGEKVDEDLDAISNDIKKVVNWAISTDTGDVAWLQGD